MIQKVAHSIPIRLNTLLAGLLCLVFAGIGNLAFGQDLEKIGKTPRRLVKKLAEDLAKDGLEDPYSEAMRVFRMLDPSDKELADLRAKTQKTLFKAKKKPKTKRLAKHQSTCVSIASKVSELIVQYPDAEEPLSKVVLALDHNCVPVHEGLGHVKGEDGIWRTPHALELQKKWQQWGKERIVLMQQELKIKEKMAPNWTRVALGQETKGYEALGVHLSGKQHPDVLKERLTTLVRCLQLVNYFAHGNTKSVEGELQHLCAGTSAADYKKALTTLQEHKLVSFGDMEHDLKFKNGCFFGYSVDRLDKEKKWIDPVLTSALHDRWRIGVYPNWFSAGLSNYVVLMLTDVEKEVPEGWLPRPEGLIKKVDQPVAAMMRNRKLSHFEAFSFTPASELTPLELALATNLVEFILLTADDPMHFQDRYHDAVTKVLEASNRPQSFEWEKMLEEALDKPFKEFEAEWLEWLNASEGYSLQAMLGEMK